MHSCSSPMLNPHIQNSNTLHDDSSMCRAIIEIQSLLQLTLINLTLNSQSESPFGFSTRISTSIICFGAYPVIGSLVNIFGGCVSKLQKHNKLLNRHLSLPTARRSFYSHEENENSLQFK